MPRVETIVVGGGIGAGTPFDLNFVPIVGSTDPPLLITTDFMFTVPTGANRGLILNPAGTDPAVGPEVLRVKGGAIFEPLTGTTGTAIGDGADSGADGQILIGIAPVPGAGTNNIHIGNASETGATSTAIAIGQGARNLGGGIVIGNAAHVLLTGSLVHVCLGAQVAASGSSACVAIGGGATLAVTTGNVVVGTSVTLGSSATNATIVGHACSVNAGFGATILGSGCAINTNTFNNCIAIGNGASCWQTRMISVGSNASLEPPTLIAFGHGINNVANPTAFLIRLTNASGSDNTAGALTLQAGLSTGNIVGPGVKLDAGIPGASGATLQTARTWVEARPTTTATQTGLMIWDVDNATLERVSVGAAESGGAGFKLLRIPN